MSEDHLDDLVNNPQGTVARWAQAAVAGRINSLEQRLHETSVEACRQRSMAALDADSEIGGKWRKINQDPEFIAWTKQIDEFNGVPRISLLQRAFDDGHVSRVAAIFKAFIASRTPARERTAERLPYEPTGEAPGVRSSTGVHAARSRVFSKAEISRFYSDVRKGYYDKRDDERLRVEKEIFEAAQQGRVEGGGQPRMPGKKPYE